MWESLSFATQEANDNIDFKISTRNRSYTKLFIVINKPLGGLHLQYPQINDLVQEKTKSPTTVIYKPRVLVDYSTLLDLL